jgi:hypothetical protein
MEFPFAVHAKWQDLSSVQSFARFFVSAGLAVAALSVADAGGCFNSSSVFGRNLIISMVFRLRSGWWEQASTHELASEKQDKRRTFLEICPIDRHDGADRQRQSQCPLDKEKRILEMINGNEE